MNRKLFQIYASLFLVAAGLLFADSVMDFFREYDVHAATIYYVCTATGSPCNASDANNGTSKTTAWLHAPGMPNFTGTYVHSAGDQIILRGGDTWHRSSGSPTMGGTWTWSNSGANAGSPDYLGVDQTWFNSSTCGASWCRPIINGDNPLSTSQPSSCSFADDSLTYVSVSGSFVTFDNFEFTGDCQTTQSFVNFVNFTSGGHNRIASNLYFHGWTLASTATDDRKIMLSSGDSSSPPTDISTLNVWDGRDSSLGTVCAIGSTACVANCWNGSGAPATPCATGWAMGGNWASIDHSIFVLVSNAMEIGDVRNVHDVLLDHIFEPIFSSRHGNGFETLSSVSGCTFSAWNVIVRNINEGENWNSACATQVFYNFDSFNDQHFPPDPNCFLMEPLANNSSAIITVDFRQSTIDSTCKLGAHASTWALGSSSSYENNHLIGFTSIANWVACNGQTTCSTTQTDNGGEVFMTTGTATTQNYLLANDFSPGNGGGVYSTVHAGNDLTSTCGTGNFTSDLCSGTTKGCSEASGSGGFVASCPAIAVVPRGSSWDAGAYQLTGSQANAPSCSPGSGTYTANQTVTCTNPNSGTTVMCYSTSTTPATNGSGTGCTTGTQYTTALTVSANETLNVIAGTSTLTDSSVVTYSYVLQGGAPICSPVGGTYVGAQSITLSQPQSLNMCYTTNGSTPSSTGAGTCNVGTQYSTAISVATSETIMAIGMANGWTDSSTVSCIYTINPATGVTSHGITISNGITLH